MWRKNRKPSTRLFKRSAATGRQFWPGIGIGGGAGLYPGLYPGQQQQQQGGGFGQGGLFGQNPQSKCWGTDPNRNFDIAHGSAGSTDEPCQDTFHGEAPFSEEESKALRDIVYKIQHNHDKLAAYVSVHAYSQLWMIPNGHVKNLSPHHNDLMEAAEAATQAIQNTHGLYYKPGPIAKVIYQAAGSSVDWVHTKAGVKYAFALELRDRGQQGFMLNVAQIKPTVEETWAGLNAMAKKMIQNP